jgi:poly(hydroxyalkanoate) depolymerase family esterase
VVGPRLSADEMAKSKNILANLLAAARLTRARRLVGAYLRRATTVIQGVLRRGSDTTEAADRRASKSNRGPSGGGSKHWSFEGLPYELPAGDTAPQIPRPPTTLVDGHAGNFLSGSYTSKAGSRPYKLYIPTSYAQQRLPLVVVLHGCTQSADAIAKGTRMNTFAEEQHCFVLYPEQPYSANRLRCWNWFKRSDQGRDQGEPAILAGMTREVMRRYRIDRNRVYVAGMSAGGAMAAVMGAAYPDIYAAIGVHSGLACGSAQDLLSAIAALRGTPQNRSCDDSAPFPGAEAMPTIVFHGDRDRTVHPRNGEHLVSRMLEKSGAPSAEASVERGRVPGGHAYTRAIHRDSTGRVVLEYWRVHGGGHAWFGGSPRGSYTDPRGPDATRQMMRFFYQNTLKQNSYDGVMGRWATLT